MHAAPALGPDRHRPFRMVWGALLAVSFVAPTAHAQTQPQTTAVAVPAASTMTNPIAIVPLDSRAPGSAAVVTGALQVVNGRALISSSGTVTSGQTPTEVALPNRGALRICAATTVKLATETSAPVGELPGLLLAMDHGAIEASVTTGQNADTVLTPDFRILIGGSAAADVKVRLGQGGDTCVDNPGTNAPYVLVTSVFDGRLYRVQPGQRVMFQHGSIDTVVDQEKESCGCPPTPAETQGNEFPLAQSEGMAPTPIIKASPNPSHNKAAQAAPPLVYNAGEQVANADAKTAESEASAPAPAPPAAKSGKARKPGFFSRLGRFFRRVFGAE